ncbi:MAG: M81 family metallopeptidase [candidate division Zixibacteria bacterium]|nr:M81 family metallopeptidase [candidate division Zixibacteria bacterium]
MRVGILSLIHESNTFIVTPTTIDMFRRDALLTGARMADAFRGGHHEISGFLKGLEETGIEAVALFYASTPPSGTITRATCEELVRLMMDEFDRHGPFDGMLTAPHGANAGEGPEYRDLDGHWLTRLREKAGPDMPIVCTIDPHANLSPRMVTACNATIAYRTTPHLDQKARGLEAARLLASMLRGEVRPTQAAAFPSVAIGIERQLTSAPPCLPLHQRADAWLEKPGVLSNSITLGFPYADVEEIGSAFIAVTDNDPVLARQIVDDLAGYLVEHRHEFVGEFTSIEKAVDRAVARPGPVCLLDMGDNVGGGSAADGTLIAHELYRRKIKGFVCLYDPESVRAATEAGVGSRLTLAMGGKTDDLHGPPLIAEVQVRSLHDGHFTESEVRHGGGKVFNMGPTAVVVTDSGLTVSLTSLRTVPVSLGLMTSCGLSPDDFQVVIAKGVHAPVPAYRPVCTELIRVDTPGATTADMRRFTYRHRRHPMFPFEEIP